MSEEIAELQQESMEKQIPEAEPSVYKAPPAKNASSPAKPNNTASLEMLMDVLLLLTVELGRAELTVKQVLDLQKGSVVELDRIAGDAVDVFVNNHLIAKGEVVVVDDKFGVRITELVSPVSEEEVTL
ncbi:MAG: flagellar motor switch protein FliN [Anaerolineales bacterium]